MDGLVLILRALLVLLLPFLWKALIHLVWRPYSITKYFSKQGVRGPPYRFWFGSIGEMKAIGKEASRTTLADESHDITARVLPYYRKWSAEYGGVFLYWFGAQPRFCVTDPELVKQVMANKFGFYGKIDPPPGVAALLGNGLVLVEGADWVRHRRVVSPAFAMDKLKALTKTMAECAKLMLDGWQDHAGRAEEDAKEIEVAEQFRELTADVISKTAFGSSFTEGREVFFAQRELLKMMVETSLSIDIPGSKYIPSRRNLYRLKLERRLTKTLVSIIQARLELKEQGFGNDLLGLMLDASHKQEGQMLSMDDIVDECKTFYFAGHETTSVFLAWTMYLLSTNLDWQEKLREEVLRECGMEIPNADTLSKLKLVTMVLLEAIRLYSPFVVLRRKTNRDMTLGDIKIPKDTQIDMPIMITHREKDVWAAADKFDPQRFENGAINAASHPTALLSFSIGPRACIGQNFAMLEAKTVIAMTLQRFSFSLSSKYIHAPQYMVSVQPQYGIPIVLKPLRV